MPKPTPENQYPLEFPSQAVNFDPDAFDELIRTQGVEMVHYRAVPCPVGLIDPNDQRHPRDHHINCSNGYIYVCAGTVLCSFLSNSKEQRQIDIGRMDGSSVTVTFPRYYEKCNLSAPDVPVQPSAFDRIYLKEPVVPVVTWEKFACSAGGIDKLRYPIVCVTDIYDAKGVAYHQDIDFVIREGKVVWNQGKSPGIDPESNRGVVCGIRYTYHPFWYVSRMVHEVRVAQVEDDMGDRSTMRFPQQMVLQREVVFENEQADKDAKKSPRQNPGPNDSNFDIAGNLGTK